MPTYQYRCAKCSEQFELWQSIHDDALQRHPGCGGKVTTVLSPAGIVLKGPGFYRTDNRTSAGKGRDQGEKSEKAEKSEKPDKTESSTSTDKSSSNGSGSKDTSKSSSSTGSEKASAKSSKKDS